MPADAKVRSLLDSADLPDIRKKLVVYAELVARKHFIKRDIESLPDGRQVEDFVDDAIALVYSGKRRWNPDQVPDLLFYLKGVIDSLVSHFFESPANERRDYSRPRETEEDPIETVPEVTKTPTSDSDYKEFVEYLHKVVEGNPIMENIVACIEAGISKRAEIIEYTGYTPNVVDYNLDKIRKLVNDYKNL